MPRLRLPALLDEFPTTPQVARWLGWSCERTRVAALNGEVPCTIGPGQGDKQIYRWRRDALLAWRERGTAAVATRLSDEDVERVARRTAALFAALLLGGKEGAA